MDIFQRYQKFLGEIMRKVPEPQWTTPNNAVLDLENLILRDFSVGQEDKAMLILPPRAGQHSNIVDYGPGQSLVEAALQAGKKSVYAIEWKSAEYRHRNHSIDEQISSTGKCMDLIGRKACLVGLCQGGWQAAIYAAMHPGEVSSLVLAAAPIDFHAGNGVIKRKAQAYPMETYESVVALSRGNVDGRAITLAFNLLKPYERFLGKYIGLYSNIDDAAYLERFQKLRNWYEYPLSLPGKYYLQVVKELFKENRLIKGELAVLGQKVDLKNIACPLHLLAGSSDHITTPEQLFNIEHYASSKSISKYVVPAGHIGVFMGKKAISEFWPKIFAAI